MSFIFKAAKLICDITTLFQYGFVQCHAHLSCSQLEKIRGVLDSKDDAEKQSILLGYEEKFGRLIGRGSVSSFASGRMAFYALMETLGIGEGDEVILTAFTCSVMPNAVLKRGAIPIYADIDSGTFGSNAKEIQKVITTRTKLIVAQHSFGIPCDIEPIIRLAKERGIYVVEDCAITLDSSLNGIKVGNWGDAAIFSTDHSKPINTVIGGLLYTRSPDIHKKVIQVARSSLTFSYEHQERLFRQMMFERKHYIPAHYPRTRIFSYLEKISAKMKGASRVTYMEDNYVRPNSIKERYPYPAQMPAFLAQLGMFELDRWEQQKQRRKQLLASMLEKLSLSNYSEFLPAVYSDQTRDIVPLRFVFSSSKSAEILVKLAKHIDVSWIWFRQPITCAVEGMESLLYVSHSCPVSEKIGSEIVNLPCNVIEGAEDVLLQVVDQAFYSDEKE